jgi:hypothetical protein
MVFHPRWLYISTELGIDGRIILRRMLKGSDVRTWTGLI